MLLPILGAKHSFQRCHRIALPQDRRSARNSIFVLHQVTPHTDLSSGISHAMYCPILVLWEVVCETITNRGLAHWDAGMSRSAAERWRDDQRLWGLLRCAGVVVGGSQGWPSIGSLPASGNRSRMR
jgi:hypothetical protein